LLLIREPDGEPAEFLKTALLQSDFGAIANSAQIARYLRQFVDASLRSSTLWSFCQSHGRYRQKSFQVGFQTHAQIWNFL
jgi:hypothetical protein